MNCVGTWAIVGLLGAQGSAEDPLRIQSSQVEIAYEVNAESLPLTSVELWCTRDRGQSWEVCGRDADRQSPLSFEAPAEGLIGLYLIVTNATGPSSQRPGASTEPQLWAFVDWTAPVVQLHQVRPTTSLGQRVLQVRWTAVDAHLLPRPIEISYQVRPEERWHAMSDEPLANTGRFDWRVPEQVAGSVAVRIAVSDRGGHRVLSEPQLVELARGGEQIDEASLTGRAEARLAADFGTTAVSGSRRAKELAERLITEAATHRERGDYRSAVARLREAVRLDPSQTLAFAEMGGMLYRLGDWDRALAAYRIALSQDPNLRSALLGSARIFTQKKDYGSAAERLRTILRYDPTDAETWLALGDVAVYQGDEMLARECYTRAAKIGPGAGKVAEDAKKRLAVMAEVGGGN